VLSGVITKMGVLGVIRVLYSIAGVERLRGTWVQMALLGLTTLTILMGSLLALKEKKLKKRLAYSSVSQVSYVLFGLFTMTEIGFVGAVLHVIFHSLMKNTLFMSAGSIIHKTEKTYVYEMDGLGRRMPWTYAFFTVASLGLVGIPPTGGFISKWNLAQGALATGLSVSWSGPTVLLISAILTAAYLFTVVIKDCFPGEDVKPEPNCEAGIRMLAPMAVFAALIVLLGVFSGPIISYLETLASTLL
jgi:multicomponent Na+:H+ antiporter subunit D